MLGPERRTKGTPRLSQDTSRTVRHGGSDGKPSEAGSGPLRPRSCSYSTKDRTLWEARELASHDFADRVEQMSDTEQSKVIASMVRSRTRGKATMLSCDRASLEQYAQFKGQLARRDFHWTVVPEEAPMYDTPAVPFRLADIQREIDKDSRQRKGTRRRRANNELLIYAAVSEVVWLVAMLFCACWRTATVPSSWRVSLIFSAPKKGDLGRIGR